MYFVGWRNFGDGGSSETPMIDRALPLPKAGRTSTREKIDRNGSGGEPCPLFQSNAFGHDNVVGCCHSGLGKDLQDEQPPKLRSRSLDHPEEDDKSECRACRS